MIAEDDKVIKIIQSSTRGLLASFRNKTQLLKECSNDIIIKVYQLQSIVGSMVVYLRYWTYY
jgi:hypothetical protein